MPSLSRGSLRDNAAVVQSQNNQALMQGVQLGANALQNQLQRNQQQKQFDANMVFNQKRAQVADFTNVLAQQLPNYGNDFNTMAKDPSGNAVLTQYLSAIGMDPSVVGLMQSGDMSGAGFASWMDSQFANGNIGFGFQEALQQGPPGALAGVPQQPSVDQSMQVGGNVQLPQPPGVGVQQQPQVQAPIQGPQPIGQGVAPQQSALFQSREFTTPQTATVSETIDVPGTPEVREDRDNPDFARFQDQVKEQEGVVGDLKTQVDTAKYALDLMERTGYRSIRNIFENKDRLRAELMDEIGVLKGDITELEDAASIRGESIDDEDNNFFLSKAKIQEDKIIENQRLVDDLKKLDEINASEGVDNKVLNMFPDVHSLSNQLERLENTELPVEQGNLNVLMQNAPDETVSRVTQEAVPGTTQTVTEEVKYEVPSVFVAPLEDGGLGFTPITPKTPVEDAEVVGNIANAEKVVQESALDLDEGDSEALAYLASYGAKEENYPESSYLDRAMGLIGEFGDQGSRKLKLIVNKRPDNEVQDKALFALEGALRSGNYDQYKGMINFPENPSGLSIDTLLDVSKKLADLDKVNADISKIGAETQTELTQLMEAMKENNFEEAESLLQNAKLEAQISQIYSDIANTEFQQGLDFAELELGKSTDLLRNMVPLYQSAYLDITDDFDTPEEKEEAFLKAYSEGGMFKSLHDNIQQLFANIDDNNRVDLMEGIIDDKGALAKIISQVFTPSKELTTDVGVPFATFGDDVSNATRQQTPQGGGLSAGQQQVLSELGF